MDEILESIINGQRKQALRQLQRSDYSIVDLLEELKMNGMNDEVITMVRVAISVDYLTEGISVMERE